MDTTLSEWTYTLVTILVVKISRICSPSDCSQLVAIYYVLYTLYILHYDSECCKKVKNPLPFVDRAYQPFEPTAGEPDRVQIDSLPLL